MNAQEWHWLLLTIRRFALCFVHWVEKRPWYHEALKEYKEMS